MTFFEIFQDRADFLQLLEDKIKSEGIVDQKVVDDYGEVIDNILIRKIYWTLNIPVINSEAYPTAIQSIERPSIMQTSMFEEINQHMLDSFLRLSMLSREYRVSDLVGNFKCFEKVFQI